MNVESTIEEVSKTIADGARSTLKQLIEMWEQLGLTQDMIEQRLDQFRNYYTNIQDDMLEEERTVTKNIRKCVQELEDDIEILRKRLDVESDATEGRSVSLLRLKDELEEEKSLLIKQCSDKLRSYNELLCKESELCKSLGQTPVFHELPEGNIPTAKTMGSLEQRIKDMERMKKQMTQRMQSRLDSVISISEQLELKKEDNADILDLTDLTENGFQRVQTWIDQKKEELKANVLEIQILTTRLELQWDCFDIDRTTRYAFFQSHRGFGTPTIRAFSEEIELYMKKKQENPEKFLNKLVKELQIYWEKCFVSEDHKLSFQKSANPSDTGLGVSLETLEHYEQETARWRQHYMENSVLFHMLAERDQLLKKIKALNEQKSDPARYKNRGGNLLKEEKEWNRVIKEIRKMESALLEKAAAYTEETGLEFLVYGNPLQEYILSSKSSEIQKRTKAVFARQKSDAGSASSSSSFFSPRSDI